MIPLRSIFIILSILSSGLNAKLYVKDTVSIVGGIDTNSLYMESSSGMDYLLRLDPELDVIFDKREIILTVGGGIDYNRYFKNTEQSFFKWKFNGGLDLRPEEQTLISFVSKYDNNSDPILMDTETRSKWDLLSIKANIEHDTKSRSWKFISGIAVDSKKYDDDVFDNFNNKKAYINIESRYFFFPETALKLGVVGGRSYYTAGYSAAPYGNSDSVYIKGFTGITGRLSDSIKMDLTAGFLWMNYQYGLDFHEPIITMKITDIMSNSTSLSAVYERMAYDSVYSNFYVDEKVAIELKSIWYDSIVNLATFQYIYRYYRLAPKRVDHRLGFITEFSIPLFVINGIKENISFTTRAMAEWVNSDAYNSFGFYTGPDPSASYSRIVVLVGLTNKF